MKTTIDKVGWGHPRPPATAGLTPGTEVEVTLEDSGPG